MDGWIACFVSFFVLWHRESRPSFKPAVIEMKEKCSGHLLKKIGNVVTRRFDTFFLPFFVCCFENKSWDPAKRKESALFLFYCARDEQ
jgi:hypothetical protein